MNPEDDEANELTSTEALARAGYTHRAMPGSEMRREIVNADGEVVARLKAWEVWEWLREQAK